MEQYALALAIADAIVGTQTAGPAFDASHAFETIEQPVASPARPVWPALTADPFSDLGSARSKAEANLAAIEVMATLRTEAREPTLEERHILNRFTGWGAAPKAFDHTPWNHEWASIQTRLRVSLSDSQFESARASTPDAHYTDPTIVEHIWATIQRMGFKGGRILEPAAGTGFFLGAMPTEIAERSEITAVELDQVSADILDALYGPYGVRVIQGGLETVNMPDGTFDLAISNVPFGKYQVPDTRKVAYADWSIHNWFIARMLDAVRPGGLVAVITSAWTMDARAEAARRYFALQADLLGAVRLPKSAFLSIANTDVTTDILVFQRRATPLTEYPEWAGPPVALRTGSALVAPGWPSYVSVASHEVNPLYAEEASVDRLVGRFTVASSQFGPRLAVSFEGTDEEMSVRIGQALETVRGWYTPAAARGAPQGHFEEVEGADGLPPGSFVITTEGSVARLVSPGVAEVTPSLPASRAERIVGLMSIRDIAMRLTRAQVTDDDDTQVNLVRGELNGAYDVFVAKFGPIHHRANRQAFRADPGWPLLVALERWNEETSVAAKADIFRVRTVSKSAVITSCDTAEAALAVSLSRKARVDPSLIATLTGRTEAEVMAELADKAMVFREPLTARWVDRSDYLSGNIAEKIRDAEWSGPVFKDHVAALRAVLPAPVGPGDIRATLGAVWIPQRDFEAFVTEVLSASATVRYDRPNARWSVNGASSGVAVRQTWGTFRIDAFDLMERAMNGQFPTVKDTLPSGSSVVNRKETLLAREKQEKMKSAFIGWIWQCPERSARLVDVYNKTFNVFVPRQYDGSLLELPGYSREISLRKNQLDGAWRILTSGKNTLLAHCVGAGKTLTAIIACMEARRVGLARKPCVVVPNNVLEQFAAEWLRAYPSAKVLMATKESFTPENRACFLNQVATGSWDAVLMTHSTFESIPLCADEVKQMIASMIIDLELAIAEGKSERSTRDVKRLETQKKSWEARLTKMAATAKAASLTFDQLGIDFLVADESQVWKSLFRITRLQVPGVPTTDSLRSFDMLLKTRHVMAKRPDKAGIVFMSATPIANSVSELWVNQTFLQPETLARLGVGSFDAWAATFGEVVSALEMSPDGSGYRMKERFARFVNVPELMRIFDEVADIRTREMLALPTPNVTRKTEVIPTSDALRRYVETLVARAEAIKDGKVEPSQDNMLCVTTDGRRAALDLRLVGLVPQPDSKIDRCAANILRIHQESMPVRGAQLVFCDLSTPAKGGAWNVYEQLRSQLVEAGVPESEVAFIHDASTDTAKEALFQSVRDGRVRVLLGSTAKMGTGTNVQKRLVALHHLDAPWRPADVEQREGRIDRQGNVNDSVEIWRYVVEGSFDGYSWQTLETKARFIAQVMSGTGTIRSVEDVELAALSYAEVKALASGNPLIIEKAEVDSELMRLSVVRSRWLEDRYNAQHRLASLPEDIARLEQRLDLVSKDLATVESALPSWGAAVETKRGMVSDPKELGRLLESADAQADLTQKTLSIGKVCGLSLVIIPARSRYSSGTFVLRGLYEHDAFDGAKRGHVMVARLQDFLLSGFRDRVKGLESTIARMHRERTDLASLRDVPFEHEARFVALTCRRQELEEALGVADGALEVAEAA